MLKFARVLMVAAAVLLLAEAAYLLMHDRRRAPEQQPKVNIRQATAAAVARSRDDMQSLRTVDESIVKYSLMRTIATGLEEPRGIALGPDGVLYVVGDRMMCVVDAASGELKRRLELLSEPTCVSVDEAGNIHVGYQRFIEVYTSQGVLHTRWEALGERSYLTSIATGGGHVLAADAGTRTVLHYNKWGVIQGRLGEAGSGSGPFLVPSPHFDVAITREGALLVTNPGKHAIEMYSPEATLVTSWGQTSQTIEGFCGCCNPTDIAVMADGRVVTSEKGLPRVKVYTAGGMLDAVVAVPDDFSPHAAGMDLAVDDAGDVWVLDPLEGVVKVFAPKDAPAMPEADATAADMQPSGAEEPAAETDAAPAEGSGANTRNE